MSLESYLIPDWPAPSQVKAFYTTRLGGNSQTPFASFNLSNDYAADPQTLVNRLQVQKGLKLKQPIQFLEQVHGTQLINLKTDKHFVGDAAYTNQTQQVCAVLTADCLPLLVTNQSGTEVAAIHAGWRGLLAGVIDETIKAFQSPRSELLVYLGPAIGPCHFEVKEAIRESYLSKDPHNHPAFIVREEKLFANLYELARQNLKRLGVEKTYGGKHCTYCEDEFFYSYRRDHGQTGRLASLIWITST